MIVPTPIENLPRFNTVIKPQTPSNSWLKILLIGGLLIAGFVIVASVVNTTQQGAINADPRENEGDPEH